MAGATPSVEMANTAAVVMASRRNMRTPLCADASDAPD
jgi:hypothetical protein